MGFPGRNTEVGYHSLFQGIFQTQGSNPGFPHWQADSLPLSHLGSPAIYTHYPTIKGKNCLHLHGEEGEEQNGQTTCLRSHSKLGTTPPTNPVPSPLAPASCFSVQFSHSVMSDSLQPLGLQHTRFPCPSPTPRACSNSCPSSW